MRINVSKYRAIKPIKSWLKCISLASNATFTAHGQQFDTDVAENSDDLIWLEICSRADTSADRRASNAFRLG